jgi:L-2,4-diaminobutyrate decarboxylase
MQAPALVTRATRNGDRSKLASELQPQPCGRADEVEADARSLVLKLLDRLLEVVSAHRPLPATIPEPMPVPEWGAGLGALDSLWAQVISGSTMLASPGMIGHMNTAAHIVTALTDALISQINNNLIFRELSPFASRVEELMVKEFATRLGLSPDTPGTFCSGGSIANLTALFAATGGFSDAKDRRDIVLLTSEAAHSSIPKAAAILGIPKMQAITIPTDAAGHMDPEALWNALAVQRQPIKIVAATLGTTLQGAVDDIPAIVEVGRKFGAWIHVDAVFGGNLAFSARHRNFLAGLAGVDSISVGPQKWLYVPRLSALVLILRPGAFERGLDWPMPYSSLDEGHRGRWGVQASRRADVVTLWVLLQVIGAGRVGEWLDDRIDLAGRFHRLLEQHEHAVPIHQPDLTLQLFGVGPADGWDERITRVQRRLAASGLYWLSLATWRQRTFLRAALLNRSTRLDHLTELLDLLCAEL